jgi:hypothetical protein
VLVVGSEPGKNIVKVRPPLREEVCIDQVARLAAVGSFRQPVSYPHPVIASEVKQEFPRRLLRRLRYRRFG